MSEPLLEVRGLKKYFPIRSGVFRRITSYVKAVDGIDFTLYPGQTLGIAGESGSGKSTACRAAIGLIEPTEGNILFEGKEIETLGMEFRRQAQIVFQDPFASLNPRKTVAETLQEVFQVWKKEADAVKETETLMELVGLSKEMLRRYPHALSGGQQQRVCIARALALKPKLLVLDEAVSALDVSVQAQILNLLMDLKNELGLSYLFVSHDLSVVRYLADELIIMRRGVIVEEGDPERLFSDPKHPYTQALMDAIPQV